MRPISSSGKVMSRSVSGSTMAKNTIVAMPAAKNDGQRMAPMRWARGRGGKSISTLVIVLLAQAEDVGGNQPGADVAQQLLLRRHHAVAAFANGFTDGVQVAAIGIDAGGQVGCTEMNVAGAVRAVAGGTVLLEQLF